MSIYKGVQEQQHLLIYKLKANVKFIPDKQMQQTNYLKILPTIGIHFFYLLFIQNS